MTWIILYIIICILTVKRENRTNSNLSICWVELSRWCMFTCKSMKCDIQTLHNGIRLCRNSFLLKRFESYFIIAISKCKHHVRCNVIRKIIVMFNMQIAWPKIGPTITKKRGLAHIVIITFQVTRMYTIFRYRCVAMI
jgi:hypothetical protein